MCCLKSERRKTFGSNWKLPTATFRTSRKHDHAKGRFATNALPDQKFEFTVDRIIPMGQPKEGNNVFKVYGTIDPTKTSESWRPGMAGEARVDVGARDASSGSGLIAWSTS